MSAPVWLINIVRGLRTGFLTLATDLDFTTEDLRRDLDLTGRDLDLCLGRTSSLAGGDLSFELRPIPNAALRSDLRLDLRSDLRLADLRLMDFPLADFPLTDFPLADLRLADLRLEDFPLEDFPLEDLRLTDLRLTDLRLTDLRLTDLRLTDFPLADVRLTDLLIRETYLTGLRLDLTDIGILYYTLYYSSHITQPSPLSGIAIPYLVESTSILLGVKSLNLDASHNM
jgi:uncharacterized protein YjbI with pentapeptide repeats